MTTPTKHTPEPWSESALAKGNIIISEPGWKRAVKCVNACAGQDIETVKLATSYKEGCIEWEREMMKVIGEDGVGSVSSAILELKQQRDDLLTALEDVLADLDRISIAATAYSTAKKYPVTEAVKKQADWYEGIIKAINNAKGGQQ